MDTLKLGPLECLTTAPEDYDYGWMRTICYNVAKGERGVPYRLVRNEDKYHFDSQVARYGSGMNSTVTEQADLEVRIDLGFLTLTPDKAVQVHYLTYDLEGLIGSKDTDRLRDALDTVEDFKPKWDGYKIRFRLVGDEARNKVADLFKSFNLELVDG